MDEVLKVFNKLKIAREKLDKVSEQIISLESKQRTHSKEVNKLSGRLQEILEDDVCALRLALYNEKKLYEKKKNKLENKIKNSKPPEPKNPLPPLKMVNEGIKSGGFRRINGDKNK